MNTEVVRLEDVWVYYDNNPALEGVNLSIEDGDFLGIIGPNGGGKSTLLKVILGLIRPVRGKVSVFGLPPEKGRTRIGYVPQSALFDRNFPISVFEVVLMGRLGRLFHGFSKEDKAEAEVALNKVEMSDFKDRGIDELSGGELQRVLVARALATRPGLLLLDEPTSNVDLPTQRSFYELLGELKKEAAIVLVSHDISAVSVYVDKIACLNRQLFYHGSKEISPEIIDMTYGCPVDLIAHGASHRVLKEHR